jgi:[ribosomal protein S18]-alanine N-acetyltransferase
MTLHIAPLPEGAVVPLAAMHRACFPADPWDAPALRLILALSGNFAFLAAEADLPAGFILARDIGGEVEILSLGVMPERRQRGIGRRLVEAAIAEAERCGAGSIVLEVAIDNEAAQQLYRGCGFRQVGRRPRYYRSKNGMLDALILRRAITGKASFG